LDADAFQHDPFQQARASHVVWLRPVDRLAKSGEHKAAARRSLARDLRRDRETIGQGR